MKILSCLYCAVSITFCNWFALIALMSVLCSCSTRESMRIIEDYEIGFLGDSVTSYYYFEQPANDTTVVSFTPSWQNNIHYVTEVTSKKGVKKSVRKFRVDNHKKQLLETFGYYYPNPYDTNNYQLLLSRIGNQEVIHGKRFDGGNYSYKTVFPENIISEICIMEVFEKDSIFVWKGQAIPALKFKDVITFSMYYRFLPFFPKGKAIESHGYTLFAKHVGLVAYHLASGKDDIFSLRLLKVESKSLNKLSKVSRLY